MLDYMKYSFVLIYLGIGGVFLITSCGEEPKVHEVESESNYVKEVINLFDSLQKTPIEEGYVPTSPIGSSDVTDEKTTDYNKYSGNFSHSLHTKHVDCKDCHNPKKKNSAELSSTICLDCHSTER